MELWDAGQGRRRGQRVPALPRQETLAVWEGVANYIVHQLMLNQGVRVIRLGTFDIVTEQAGGGKRGLLTVRRPVFRLSKNIAEVHGLTYDKAYVPGHKLSEPLKYARVASNISVPWKAVEACIEETMHLFSCCLESGKNAALVLKDIGMLVIQGVDVKMRFYRDFLRRLNGTEQLLEALLGMPEMRDSVLLGTETAASQTWSGHVIVFPEYKLESRARKPPVAPAKPSQEEEMGKDNASGKKGMEQLVPGRGTLPAKRLLFRERHPPPRITATNMQKGKGKKAEVKASRGR
ncbi:coiled-coil domain-containing protein 81-like [Struthio camelus]|uniref:coiled-coil domain-containing protein 81-like n=1 Tax=Struthio camelus TaxID=8801 RepID=UPI0036042B6D